MTLEAIEQAAKTIVESTYEYETALKNKNKKRAEQIKSYILKICSKMKKLVKEETKK